MSHEVLNEAMNFFQGVDEVEIDNRNEHSENGAHGPIDKILMFIEYLRTVLEDFEIVIFKNKVNRVQYTEHTYEECLPRDIPYENITLIKIKNKNQYIYFKFNIDPVNWEESLKKNEHLYETYYSLRILLEEKNYDPVFESLYIN